jgi:hypothetical protein
MAGSVFMVEGTEINRERSDEEYKPQRHKDIHETADGSQDAPVVSARGRLIKPSGRARD